MDMQQELDLRLDTHRKDKLLERPKVNHRRLNLLQGTPQLCLHLVQTDKEMEQDQHQV